MVNLKATKLDVFVNGKCVGWVTDCGDCWRTGLYGRRRRRGYKMPDYDSRMQAVRGVVEASK
jgi:hypothetical protein